MVMNDRRFVEEARSSNASRMCVREPQSEIPRIPLIIVHGRPWPISRECAKRERRERALCAARGKSRGRLSAGLFLVTGILFAGKRPHCLAHDAFDYHARYSGYRFSVRAVHTIPCVSPLPTCGYLDRAIIRFATF